MHSSRMCTDRLLTVCLWCSGGGVHPCCCMGVHPGGGCIQEGTSSGVHQRNASRGWGGMKEVHPGGCSLDAPPVNRMTHPCDNIIFPASLRYAVGNNFSVNLQSECSRSSYLNGIDDDNAQRRIISQSEC